MTGLDPKPHITGEGDTYMKLFRQALAEAYADKFNDNPDLIWFRPAQQYVPRTWVERMAQYEWECEETGCCSHASTRNAGCYFGQDSLEGWLCDALLMDGDVLMAPVEVIANNV